ncbi:uncharacterized protein BJ171DRAFT_557776 [Polychytrium aggregatum]|uniref:uncharacterized protein n=1 Tax=Polychytrium aggregatum TaxID=110093 RepID=UPI0022FDBBCF|nr:uncharacterized protein BJ171DRAFT_557776 [Polychytrium aggregatum]KAI9208662.1 hypothetical protein BJ171DRAFT_557776 [Polychytrium aggregatum]
MPAPPASNPSQHLAHLNEQTWFQIGRLSETLNDIDRAVVAFENVLRYNPQNSTALIRCAVACKSREHYTKAVDYFSKYLKDFDQQNGEHWGSLAHCHLMLDELQKAYNSYQRALYFLPNPKDPQLWYGIGILYDRYGSYEYAEEAFTSVISMDPKFEKASEIYFRLGIIYKQQQKYSQSLECFRYVLSSPPKPLVETDIWFQIGLVYEQQKEFLPARDAYERVLKENPNHAKVLQQMGWLYHQPGTSFCNQDAAIQFINRSLEFSDNQDAAQSHYLLGRCFMAQQRYSNAYHAFQQAINLDNQNPAIWCSIGALYYQRNQYRDALDAYSRAICLNPYLSEVWYDIGTLYEACHDQVNDAIDAYSRALELDPNNQNIKQRLQALRSGARWELL